ncbi:MAG TPA: BamA/TamA family outer membrane protein [Bacteriovoracaceae bacterium]|nr:BamA/TamA family outer membrane protein [Bacteriovoracaceae bacterium]
MFLILSILFFGLHEAYAGLCPQVILHTEHKIKFTDTEKRMLCGDPAVDAYKNIPPYQAEIFMKGFLQSRGYLQPEFAPVGEVLNVYPRSKTFIRKMRVNIDEDKERKLVEKEIQRQYRKKLMTPKRLDAIEADALTVVRRRGFPCAKIETEAFPDTRSVDLNYKDLNWFPFGKIEKEKIPDLHENALARFYPFRESDAFNEMLLDLTEKRMMRAEVVSGTFFLENCSVDARKFSLSQQFIIGPPRSIRFGAGVNTESGPMFRVKWAHNRFQPMASHLSASFQASLRIQSLNLTADQYLWNHRPRQSLFSQFDLIRESQFDYLQTLARLRPHMKWTEDKLRRHLIYTLGPTLEAGSFKSEERLEQRSYRTGALEGSISLMSHIYEYFDTHPEDGDTVRFSFDFRQPEFGFPHRLLKLDSTFAKLTRVGVWRRGNLIAGLRVNAATTIVPDSVDLLDLPPSVKFYGGGSDDVRGFLLRTLPKNDGLGALSKLGLKLELRRTYLWKESLEGFVFVDGARFGPEPWDIDPRVWYSPGVGLRWLSPIGMVQTYIARARATNPDEDFGNFYFIGLGGTF